MQGMTLAKPRLESTPAQRAAVAYRLDGLNEEQRAGNAARAVQRAAQAEREAIQRGIRRTTFLTRQELVARFPATFMPSGSPKVPLAIGILKSLFAVAPDLDRHALINALSAYCSEASYRRALVAGADRIGLDGKPSGTVSPDHAEHARKILATIP